MNTNQNKATISLAEQGHDNAVPYRDLAEIMTDAIAANATEEELLGVTREAVYNGPTVPKP